MSYKSRRPKKRSSENSIQYKAKKSLNQTEESALNLFYINTSYTNVYKCTLCKLHFQNCQVRKLEKNEFGKLGTINRMDRRFGFYYICLKCEKSSNERRDIGNQCSVLQISFQEDNEFVHYTIRSSTESSAEISQNNFQDVSQEISQELNPSAAIQALIDVFPSSNDREEVQEPDSNGNLLASSEEHSPYLSLLEEVPEKNNTNDNGDYFSSNNGSLQSSHEEQRNDEQYNQSSYPEFMIGYDLEDSLALENSLPDWSHTLQRKLITVDLPISSNVKFLYPKMFKPKKFDLEPLMHDCLNISEDTILKIYSNHLHKYYTQSGFYKGKIVDAINRKISTKLTAPMDRFIHGSLNHEEAVIGNMHHKINQNGQLYISLIVTYPFNNDETIASYLIQKNFVVTQNMESNENSQFSGSYLVHDHQADKDCSHNCNAVPMDEFLGTEFDISSAINDIIPTYIANSVKKMKEFINGILKCPNTVLEAEEYSFTTRFDKKGEIQMRGVVWPKIFSKFNKMMVDASYGLPWEEEIENDVLEKLETEIITNTDTQTYKEDFNFAQLIAESTSNMSKAFQYHVNPCSICSSPELPSFKSLITKPLPTIANKFPSYRLNDIMLNFLCSLSLDDKEQLSIQEFLDRIYEDEVQDANINESEIILIITGEKLCFVRDETLNKLILKYENRPLNVLYQYTIMFSDNRKVHLKKKMMKEAFTHSFSFFYLKAVKATIEVKPLIGLSQWISEYYKGKEPHNCDLKYHKTTSLAEAIATLDGRTINLPDSQGTVFINPLPSEYIRVKKVPKESEISYKESDNHFEEISTGLKNYMRRMNAKSITVAEYLVWYDGIGKNSIDTFCAYKDKLESIEQSEIPNIDDTEKLPSYILIANGDVAKLRKTPKVLCLALNEMSRKERQYCQVLLYSKYLKSPIISEDEVELMFSQEDPAPVHPNCNNLLNNRRRKLFPYMIKDDLI